jgi:hypothetical protein
MIGASHARATFTVGVLLLASGSIMQVSAQPPKHYAEGRTPDGDPDLRGIWEIHETVNWNLEGHAASKGVPASKTIVVDPPDGKIPYQPWALAKRASMNPADDPQKKCFLDGVPRITYSPGPFQIFQSGGLVIMIYQNQHAYRFIPTAEMKQLDSADFWLGSSIGKWEGDTLTVDTISFNDQTWFDKAGNFHGADLHVVERYSLAGPNTLQYEATIEDPKVFTKPWKIRMVAKRHTEPGFRILEDECLRDAGGAIHHTTLVE